MLKLRMIGINDYSVLESGQRLGRIRFVIERMPGVWLWIVTIHLGGGLPMGSSQHGRGGVQGGLGSAEGQDHARAARGGLHNIRDAD